MTAFTSPVTFSYTRSLDRSRSAVGGGLISWGCNWTNQAEGEIRLAGALSLLMLPLLPVRPVERLQ